MKNISQRKKARFIFFLLITIFILPLILAWFLYEHPKALEEKKLNFGELISPPFPLSLLTLYNNKGQPINNIELAKGKWTLLLLNPGFCDQACKKKLFFLRQIRLATGKNRNRVQRIVLAYLGGQTNHLAQLIQTHYQGTRLVFTEKNQFLKLIHHHISHRYASREGTVFIIDPYGNVIMSYEGKKNPMNIYKDLSRLLKLSQIG